MISWLDQVTLHFHSKRTLMKRDEESVVARLERTLLIRVWTKLTSEVIPQNEWEAISYWDNSNSTLFPVFTFCPMAPTTNRQVFAELDTVILNPTENARTSKPRRFHVFIQTPWNLTVFLYAWNATQQFELYGLRYYRTGVPRRESRKNFTKELAFVSSPLNIRFGQIK